MGVRKGWAVWGVVSTLAASLLLSQPVAAAALKEPSRAKVAVASANLFVNKMPQACEEPPCRPARKDVLTFNLSSGLCLAKVRFSTSQVGSQVTLKVTARRSSKKCAPTVGYKVSVDKGVTAVVDGSTGVEVPLTVTETH